MIIDIHTHQFAVDENWKSVKFPPVEWSDTLLEWAARLGIQKICLLGNFKLHPTPELVAGYNDLTLAMVRRHPGRIYGLCYLNATHDQSFIDQQIDRCVRHGPLSGVKMEMEVNARDPKLDPILEQVVELDAFVLHHAWYKPPGKVITDSDSADIAHLAARHPKATILMAHLTANGIRGVWDIAPYPNVLVDTSGSQPFSGIVEFAVRNLGPQRVLYGSDAVGRDFAAQLGRVLGAKLTEEEREMVLWRNAARLLKIQQEALA